MIRPVRAAAQRGQALAELALSVPVLVGLFALTLQGGLVIDDQINLQHAAYEGVQWAVANRTTATTTDIQNHIYRQLCGVDSNGNVYAVGASAALTRYCSSGGLVVSAATTGATGMLRPAGGPILAPLILDAEAATCQKWDLAIAVTWPAGGSDANNGPVGAGQTATITVTLVGPDGAAGGPSGAGSSPLVTLSAANLPAGLTNGTPFLDPPTVSTAGSTSKMLITPSSHTSPGTYDIKFGGIDQCGNDPTSSSPEKDVVITITGGSGPANPPASNSKIHGLLPICVPIGGNVLINGENFVAGSTVTISGQSAAVTSVSGNQLVVVVPSGVLPPGQTSGKVSVTVTNPDGTTVSLANAVTVGNCTGQVNPQNSPGSATPCFLGGAGAGGTEYTVTITWTETLVIPWISRNISLAARMRGFCQ